MTQSAVSRRSDAGFWSSSASFFLPVGELIDREGVRGYPIDLRIKAGHSAGPEGELLSSASLYVDLVQYGLGCYEKWLVDHEERWLHAASLTADYMLEHQSEDGSWYHQAAFPHTYRLSPPWASGMAQGQAASLLTRLYLETGAGRLADAARLALTRLMIPQREGGVRGELGGLPWPEEYPTTPQSHVLNGAIFALWGMRDVAIGLRDEQARREYDDGVDALAANLGRYDTGSWSLYDLAPHPIRNHASSFYHDLHVNQLGAMQILDPRPEIEATRERWATYAQSRYSKITAFAWKAAFRLVVPRDRFRADLLRRWSS